MSVLCSCACADWAIFGLTLVGLAYLYATWNYGYWKKRGVHFVKPFPLLGNVKESTMARKSLGDEYVDLYKIFKSHKYGGFYKFREPALMLCDVDLIKNVMTRDFPHFHDNDIYVTVDMDPMFGRNPFVLRGDKWKAVRSQLTPAFTPGKLKPLFPLINEVVRDLKEYLSKDYPDGLEAKEVAAKFTTDVVATCIFGLNGNSFTDPKAIFREMGRSILATGFWQNLKIMIVFMMPSVASFFKMRLFTEKVTNFFRSVTKDATTYRETNNVTRNDFLQLLMQLKAKGSFDDDESVKGKLEKFTDDDIAAHATTFFTDGFETSSSGLAFALYELAVNPDIQETLRAEIDDALEKHNGVLSYELVQDIPYAEMVLSESLRKYPPAPFLTRICTKAYDLPAPGGATVRVEKDTPIAVPILALHMDPEHYPEPEVFDPLRFNEANKAARHPYAYLPFGAGPRACLGTRFAHMQMRAGMVAILSNFEVQLCERTAVPLVMDPSAFLTTAIGGIWLKFVPRSDK